MDPEATKHEIALLQTKLKKATDPIRIQVLENMIQRREKELQSESERQSQNRKNEGRI